MKLDKDDLLVRVRQALPAAASAILDLGWRTRSSPVTGQAVLWVHVVTRRPATPAGPDDPDALACGAVTRVFESLFPSRLPMVQLAGTSVADTSQPLEVDHAVQWTMRLEELERRVAALEARASGRLPVAATP